MQAYPIRMRNLPVVQSDAEKPPGAAAEDGARASQVTEIRPSIGLLDLDWTEFWQFRGLLYTLTVRDIQILYKQAALGAAWAIIQPIFAVTIFSVVFGRFVGISSDGVPYPLFAFAAVLLWTYFAEALRRSATNMVSDAELIRKVYFPRLVMPLAGAIAPLLDLALGFVVLLVLMAWYGHAPGWQILLAPAFVIIAGLLALSIGLWLGPINIRFRDIKHTIPFLIQVWMYASPVIYPLSIIPKNLRWIYSLNPMVGIVEGFRWAVLGTEAADFQAIAVGAVLTAALLCGGLVFFRHMERTFADTI
jgi:lipopolysaccharide transport system permease protein